MVSIILFFLACVFGYYTLRLLILFFRGYRNMRKAMKDFRRAASGDFRNDPRGGGRAQGSRPPVKKKKIPRDVGEYVAFTEVAVETQTESTDSDGNTTTESSFEVEQQVVDVKWEDI